MANKKIIIEINVDAVYHGVFEDKENPGVQRDYYQLIDTENDKTYGISKWVYDNLKLKNDIKLELAPKTRLVCPDQPKTAKEIEKL